MLVNPDPTFSFVPVNTSKMRWYSVALLVASVVGFFAIAGGVTCFFAGQNLLPPWLAKLSSLGAIGCIGTISMLSFGSCMVLLGFRGLLGLIEGNQRRKPDARLVTKYPEKQIVPDPYLKPKVISCHTDCAFYMGSLIAYPLIAVVGLLGLMVSSAQFISSALKEKKLISLLDNKKSLKKYCKNKETKNEKKVFFLIKELDFFIKKAKLIEKLGIPQANLREAESLKAFRDAFSNIDFSHFPTIKETDLKQLQVYQMKLLSLRSQHRVLRKENIQLEEIKKVALMSLIKTIVKKETHKKWMITTSIWVIPFGFFYSANYMKSSYNISSEGRAFNKAPRHDHLKEYSTLLAAHNALVSEYDYLPPYRTKSSI